MTSQRRSLLAGVLIGLLVATSIWFAQQFVLSRRPVKGMTETAATPAPSADVAPTPTPDIGTSVQLTSEEQKSIGVETVEIKRQSVRKEITAPGKVSEPETGIGVISARIGGRIDKLLLNVTGETVRQGQPVALIY